MASGAGTDRRLQPVRLETLSRNLDRSIIVSAEFAEATGVELHSLVVACCVAPETTRRSSRPWQASACFSALITLPCDHLHPAAR